MKTAALVYVSLLILTVLTVAASLLHLDRSLALALAVVIASFKASLISYHYMHLKNDGILICGVALIGIISVLILLFGIVPDVSLYRF